MVPRQLPGALTQAGRALVSTAAERTGRAVGAGLTWRDVLHTYIVGGHLVVGGPLEIADYIESWLAAGASDGFNVQSAFLVQQLRAFVDRVVPELRHRGLFRTDYEGSTLTNTSGYPGRTASSPPRSPKACPDDEILRAAGLSGNCISGLCSGPAAPIQPDGATRDRGQTVPTTSSSSRKTLRSSSGPSLTSCSSVTAWPPTPH